MAYHDILNNWRKYDMKNYYYTKQMNFYGNSSPEQLIRRYGSPLYVYNESILRQRCREMFSLVDYPYFKVHYSTKANSNLFILKIIREEGIYADAMSPGEVYILMAAGFKPEEIFYVSNNISESEMKFIVDKNILFSADSLSQLKQYGRINPGGKIAVRLNPGIGAGHHERVITGGKKTKFGINIDLIPQIKEILNEYNLTLVGINQHIGSLFMDYEPFIDGASSLLSVAKQFEDLEFIDFGGGFGIPYRKQENEPRLDLEKLGDKLTHILHNWTSEYGKKIEFKIEPGRYIVAESGVLLGTVHSIKENAGTIYVGTDLGFNVLARPMLYDSHHDIEVYKKHAPLNTSQLKKVNVVGNICESGDIIAKDRALPEIEEGDILGVIDAGAYGFSMASNYNNRLKPAEVLIDMNGNDILIRRRDTLEDLMRNFKIEDSFIAL